MENLRQTLAAARADGTEVRGIAVINPGNPTGNILAEEQIKDIIQVNTVNACWPQFHALPLLQQRIIDIGVSVNHTSTCSAETLWRFSYRHTRSRSGCNNRDILLSTLSSCNKIGGH